MKVGIIGDTHLPAVHPAYLDFCTDVFAAWGVEKVIHIGDVVDWHSISFHDKHPDLPSAKDEWHLVQKFLEPWKKRFPKVSVCIGNHDARVTRLAESASIPAEFLKPYPEIWGTPGWDWEDQYVIDNVLYIHGNRRSGLNPALNMVKKGTGMSVVMGHCHTVCGVHWQFGPKSRWFGLDTGCGADQKSPVMRYAHDRDIKWALSCGVVIDGHPYSEVMPCDRGEPYHRSKFQKKRGRK